ncbi:hypothetical protein B296_00037450 [Ensete ventricosum]|uniref:Uncharacterized protein n=1 Tax=Ensete ventricosum TaxID=4639 RepID=A0A426XTQ2_ENSVE|nr:hypothetical protein B296_00037450 [Ensete ventricosum]
MGCSLWSRGGEATGSNEEAKAVEKQSPVRKRKQGSNEGATRSDKQRGPARKRKHGNRQRRQWGSSYSRVDTTIVTGTSVWLRGRGKGHDQCCKRVATVAEAIDAAIEDKMAAAGGSSEEGQLDAVVVGEKGEEVVSAAIRVVVGEMGKSGRGGTTGSSG